MKPTKDDVERGRAIVQAWLDDRRAHVSLRGRIAQALADERERAAKVCESFNTGSQPPEWSAELFDECELKEEAYDAGFERGAWAGHSACASAIRALGEEGRK